MSNATKINNFSTSWFATNSQKSITQETNDFENIQAEQKRQSAKENRILEK